MAKSKKKILEYKEAQMSPKEVASNLKWRLQRDDSKKYFLDFNRPRWDRAYKLYTAYNGDRAKEIQSWQSNVAIPYTLGVIETLKPRILDARPDFSVLGRNESDQDKALKLQELTDYTWEISGMDNETEDLVSASMIYGISWLQTFWKKDKRTLQFLSGKDIATKKKKYKEETRTFYDAPAAKCIDNYDMRYDWRNIPHSSKQYFMIRFVKSGAEIKRMFPDADPARLEMALNSRASDLTDYGSIRMATKSVHDTTTKNSDRQSSFSGARGGASNIYGGSAMSTMTDRYQETADPDLRFHEGYIRFQPFEDLYDVRVNEVPIFESVDEPNPYDHKDAPIIDIPFLKIPHEYEGLGYPLLLEQPQIMLNLIKNQRLDATTMGIHKMWIVNPLSNIKKEQLVTRPFGIIWSPDPNGVREVQFSDIKESAYREEEMLKADMRYASGVDDISMGVGGGAGSATETRQLRESTIERVRLFINHLGFGFSKLMRFWISMYGQFMTDDMIMRITDEQGQVGFKLIEKDDLRGEFDFKATVLPSIAGKGDVEKKQGMDLFQLLATLPFIDQKKLTSKVLHPWGWSLNSIAQEEQGGKPPGAEGMMPPGAEGGMPPGAEGMMPPGGQPQPPLGGGAIPESVMKQALGLLQGGQPGAPVAGESAFSEFSSPVNLLKNPGQPPLAPNVPKAPGQGGANIRGLNRKMGGKVNTNIPTNRGASDPGAAILNQAANIQR